MLLVLLRLQSQLQGLRLSAVGGMPPGDDPAFLNSLVLFVQDKRTDKEKYRFEEVFSLKILLNKAISHSELVSESLRLMKQKILFTWDTETSSA